MVFGCVDQGNNVTTLVGLTYCEKQAPAVNTVITEWILHCEEPPGQRSTMSMNDGTSEDNFINDSKGLMPDTVYTLRGVDQATQMVILCQMGDTDVMTTPSTVHTNGNTEPGPINTDGGVHGPDHTCGALDIASIGTTKAVFTLDSIPICFDDMVAACDET